MIVKKYTYHVFRLFALLICFMVFLNGCGKLSEGNHSFEDVTYQVKIPNDSSVVSRTESEEPSNSNVNVSADSSESTPVFNESEHTETFDAHNVLKFGCTDTRLTASLFIPSLAYMENEVARDVMFTNFCFMPYNTFVYSGDSPRKMTKTDWNNYIYNYEFKKGYSVDALEEAAALVKSALQLGDDYKVGVYFSLLYPVETVTDFGNVNGKNLNFSSGDADRISALKWMVDEHIKAFKKGNYQTLEIKGFYWHSESINIEKDKKMLNAVTDYIRANGLETVWSPYYKASGYSEWKKCKFDRASMQANYFPGNSNLPNSGGIDRIASAVSITKSRGMGLEIEFSGVTSEDAVSGTKEYLKKELEMGLMNGYHMWYIDEGPKSIRTLYKSSNTYMNSLYKDVYLF